MTWDASTAASVAALLVAFVAFIVTSAQAVQQYLVSGQLIRICDSVVYGKMPGQGRRIWEFSQFRFRVVYSIPQIRLPSGLWSDTPSHARTDQADHLTLPDLQISIAQSRLGWKQVIKEQFDRRTGRTRDLICGEASWVSFCRAIQHSCGNSLLYEMIDGDADRCPTDLPVVPMQLSMRDVITIAMMAGMECTDVSYQQQSLSMQGCAGTITSSRHPILGALIHFAPKLSHEKHGFRTNDGTVHPQWMARMRDIIMVAGLQYNMRDRKHCEEDEGDWVMLSDDRSLVKYQEKSNRESSSVIGEMRRRHGVRNKQPQRPGELTATDQLGYSLTELAANKFNDPMDISMHRPQDGEWLWSFSLEASEPEKAPAHNETGYLPLLDSTQPQPKVLPSRNWYYQITSILRGRLSATIDLHHFIKKHNVLPVSEPHERSRHQIQSEKNAVSMQSNIEITDSASSTAPPIKMRSTYPKPTEDGIRDETFRYHVEPMPRVSNDEICANAQPTPRRLLLTNKEATKTQSSSIQVYGNRYAEQEKNLAAARAKQVGRKWQSIVKRRQEVRARRSRKEQSWLRSKSNPRYGGISDEEEILPNPESQWRVGKTGLVDGRSGSHQSELKINPSSPRRNISGLSEVRRRRSTASLGDIDIRKPIPRGAKWTKINRELVSPRALEEAHERFKVRRNHVIVLRVLQREEIEAYALRTMEIREASKEQENRGTISEPSDSFDSPSFSEHIRTSFEVLPYRRPRKEALPIKYGYAADSNPDKLLKKKNSGSLHWEDEPEVVESPLTELIPKTESDTRGVVHRTSFSDDVNNFRNAASSVNANDGLSQNEKKLPQTQSPNGKLLGTNSPPDTASPPGKGQPGLQDVHMKERNHGQGQRKRVHSRVRRSSANTENSYSFKDELLHLSFDSVLKKAHERSKQCKDIPVAIGYFLESQIDRQFSIDEVIAIHEQLRDTGIMMMEMLIVARKAHEQRKLQDRTVLDLEIFVANLGKCLDVLESDFELFEITHMDVENQQKTWNEMLLTFERTNSNSLLDHLQVSDSFGNALLASLRAGRISSLESDELKAILLEMDQMQPESSLLIPPKRRPKASTRRLRRPRRTRLQPDLSPYDSDSFPDSEAGSLDHQQPQRPNSRHENDWDTQNIANIAPAGGKQLSPTGAVNWFWICQADIIPGYFATPWKGLFSEAVCIGAISAILKALDVLTDSSTRRYVKSQQRCQDWIRAGNVTYPSYAINAKGGVVVSGLYRPVSFAGFPNHLPPIELLHSYDSQVRRGVRHQQQPLSVIVDDVAELMGLDTWLSFCGRTPPIHDGPSNLLRALPALAQRILSDFEFEFANLDRTTSTDGGFELIQTVADSLTAALAEQNLSEPERLFAMVAFLRAAKTALCVVRGSDTAKLRAVLEHDIQVYLA
ncbi:hypothetical protein MMC07_004535 [Pseudocyphellaria aurata]|nr:hypothetical protein [Pseudocyphellaria aurata]